MILSLYFILLMPALYLIGWIYWFLKHKKPSLTMPRIISFHKISDIPELGGTFNTVRQFESFIRFLKENGYKTASIDKILLNPEEKEILIFFDDAYENIYNKAFPIMKEYGFTGVLCPVAGYIGKKNLWDRGLKRFNHMNDKQLKEMSEAGFEIISHSMSHSDMRRLSKESLIKETTESKRTLENLLNKKIDYFIYPFGLYNENVKNAVKRAGYKAAFASYNEKNDEIDIFAIGRNTMYIIDSKIDLKIILERKPLFLFGHEDQKGRIINWFSRFSAVIKI